MRSISAITVSPRRRRIGLYYQWHHHNLRELDILAFVRICCGTSRPAHLTASAFLHRHTVAGGGTQRWRRLQVHGVGPAAPLAVEIDGSIPFSSTNL